jgi:hypothetical protein
VPPEAEDLMTAGRVQRALDVVAAHLPRATDDGRLPRSIASLTVEG